MAFKNPIETLIIPEGAGAGDYYLLITSNPADMPPDLAAQNISSVIIFFYPWGDYIFLGILPSVGTIAQLLIGWFDSFSSTIFNLQQWSGSNFSAGADANMQLGILDDTINGGVEYDLTLNVTDQYEARAGVGIVGGTTTTQGRGVLGKITCEPADLNDPNLPATDTVFSTGDVGRGEIYAYNSVLDYTISTGTVNTLAAAALLDGNGVPITIDSVPIYPNRVYRVRVRGGLHCASAAAYRGSLFIRDSINFVDKNVSTYYQNFTNGVLYVNDYILIGNYTDTTEYPDLVLRANVSTAGKTVGFLVGAQTMQWSFQVEDAGHVFDYPSVDIAYV